MVNKIQMTHKRYTLVNQCCDPPIPATYMNTNVLKRAQKVFDELVKEEKEALGGGEFTFILFEHTPDSRVEVMRIPAKESEYGRPYIYNINFPGSIRVAEFSYMDLRLSDPSTLVDYTTSPLFQKWQSELRRL